MLHPLIDRQRQEIIAILDKKIGELRARVSVETKPALSRLQTWRRRFDQTTLYGKTIQ